MKKLDSFFADYIKEQSGGISWEELISCYERNNQHKNPTTKDWLSVKEVCEILGVSRWFVDRLRKKNILESIKLSSTQPGAVRISVKSLNAYIASLKSASKGGD